MLAAAQAALGHTRVPFVPVGDAASPTDAILGIRAHAHLVSDAATLAADVDLLAVQGAFNKQVPVTRVVRNLASLESDHHAPGLANPVRMQRRQGLLVHHLVLNFLGGIFYRVSSNVLFL